MLKIKALAEGGVGGERENAQRILEKMCESAGISVDDLNDETTHEITFKNNQLSKIAFMTLLHCFGKKACDEKVRYYTMQGLRNRQFIQIKGTPHEILTAKTAIDHYVELFKANKKSILKNMVSGFINKYDLFAPDYQGEGGKQLSYEDMLRIHDLMDGMPDDDGPRIRLSRTQVTVTEIDLHSKLLDN